MTMFRRKCRPWTNQETEHALELLSEGKSLQSAAKIMCRSAHTLRRHLDADSRYVARPKGRPAGGVRAPVTREQDKVRWDSARAGALLSRALV